MIRSLIAIPLLLTACASAGPKHDPAAATLNASREPLTPLEPAIRFSMSQEAFTVARNLVATCLEQQRLTSFQAQNQRLPVIKVVPSTVLSNGAIDPMMLEKLVEAELVNSGKVRVLSAASLSDDQENGLTVEVPERSPRPDFVITVSVAAAKTAVLTTLELIDLGSNEKVWMKVHRSGARQLKAGLGAAPTRAL